MEKTLSATPDATIIGDDGDNILNGTAGDDIILGLGGNDLLWGVEGNDTLDGGSGDDVLLVTPWDGTDQLIGGDGLDLVSYQYSWWGVNVVLSQGAYGDTFAGIEGVIGSTVADVLSAGTLAARLYGGMGNDLLWGGDGNDMLDGGSDDDVLLVTPWDGTDQLIGGDGIDLVSYQYSWWGVNVVLSEAAYGDTFVGIEGVKGSNFDDVLSAGSMAAILYGGDGYDLLIGGPGSDVLNGGYGDDTIYVTPDDGIDIIDGGAGVDFLSFQRASTGLVINMGDLAQLFGDDVSNVEGVEGSPYGDTLVGGAGWRDYIDGGEGDDTIDGGLGSDEILLRPWDGADLVMGGEGDDLVSYLNAPYGVEVSLEYAGYGDTFIDIEALGGSDYGDMLSIGPERAGVLFGGLGDDVLVGGPGSDYLYGGKGNDYIYVTAYDGADVIDGEAGYDVLSYEGANTGLYVEVAYLFGDKVSGIEEVEGSLFGDLFVGTTAGDCMDGNDGSDTIRAQAGNDTLTGGAGSDIFVLNTAPNALTNLDTILDFVSGTDTLEFSKSVFAGLVGTGTLSAEQFRSGAGITSAQDSDDRIVYDTSTGALYYDADGVGGVEAVQVVILGAATHPGLVHTDVLIGF